MLFLLCLDAESEKGDRKDSKDRERTITPDEDRMCPDGPELMARKEVRKSWDTDWNASQGVISGNLSLEPTTVDIIVRADESEKGVQEKKAAEDILKEVANNMESECFHPLYTHFHRLYNKVNSSLKRRICVLFKELSVYIHVERTHKHDAILNSRRI